MPETTMHWGAEALWEQLLPLLPGLSVEVVRSVPSTNTSLLARARVSPQVEVTDGDVQVRRSVESAAFGRRAVDVAPCLLIAEHQSAGRGRQGRSWHSVAGASLTFSLGVPLTVADWSGLSLAVGVALCEAIETIRTPASTAPRLGLKWPNDLWLGAPGEGGRKLGGLLIETVAAGSQRLAVIGVGINVEPFDADAVTTGFACAQELDPAITAPALMARVALPLVQAMHLFSEAGFGAFEARFAAHDLLVGKTVTTTSPDLPEGVARGVSAHGALRVDTAAGVHELSSGEISVRVAQDR
jgi:BirA family transcriptional regulator, biotin operon repressor / biotin---[acetyl-CoA-carboxylase] ligase